MTIAGPIKVDLFVSTTGTDSDWIVKLIDVYPDDYPDPSPNPAERADGRLPATRAGRRDARQVPQQLREAGAVRAAKADCGQVHDAGRVPHVPQRPPHDGAGAIDLVSAGRPQSAGVSSDIYRRKSPITTRRPSAFIARASCLRTSPCSRCPDAVTPGNKRPSPVAACRGRASGREWWRPARKWGPCPP